jgi:hypothetical protein
LGGIHEILLPGSYYSPDVPFRLMSPQHWSQIAQDNSPKPRGTRVVTYEDAIVLQWEQRKFTRTIQLNKNGTNVGTFRSAPGTKRFQVYAAVCENEAPEEMVHFQCFPTTISDDEESESDGDDEATAPPLNDFPNDFDVDNEPVNMRGDTRETASPPSTEQQEGPSELPDASEDPDHWHDEPATIERDDEATQATPTGELLAWHYRLNHISFSKLRMMANKGDLPKRLATCRVPKCPGCLFGKATKKPWRTKAPPNSRQLPVITQAGDCVSVDQLVSTTPGFLAQLKGLLTRRRYRIATVFVDHYSRLSFIYMTHSDTSAETLEAKHAFERYCGTAKVAVRHYHGDNGRFADNAFKQDCEKQHQALSYCGVNAHFQNGIAEKRIRDLQDNARTMMIHAQARWPSVITTNLWPYAMRTGNEIHNYTPRMKDGQTPIELFSQVPVKPQIRNFHHFGCPTYVLDNTLQGGKKIPKWAKRARLGVYLGPSPAHAQSVALILNLRTGLVSPQFHLQFDDQFETVREVVSASNWQTLAGFTKHVVQPPTRWEKVSKGARAIAHISGPTEAIHEVPTIPNGNHEFPDADAPLGTDVTQDTVHDDSSDPLPQTDRRQSTRQRRPT